MAVSAKFECYKPDRDHHGAPVGAAGYLAASRPLQVVGPYLIVAARTQRI
jgi:hypothetical protein